MENYANTVRVISFYISHADLRQLSSRISLYIKHKIITSTQFAYFSICYMNEYANSNAIGREKTLVPKILFFEIQLFHSNLS